MLTLGHLLSYNPMSETSLSIGDAARQMGVSIDTLRRWDENGKFKAAGRTPGGQRFYREHDIEIFLNNLLNLATEWVLSSESPELPSSLYCPLSPVFQTRLERMQTRLQMEPSVADYFSLLVAVAGEIGNNSYDHNIGNWPDVPGILFTFDVNKRQIILADRGQGILRTLQRVRPGLSTHEEALRVAFTEMISGREPEKRGNGLKFVRNITQDYPINLLFRTGNALINLKGRQKDLVVVGDQKPIRGCLALITF
jgi:hypothetical protein